MNTSIPYNKHTDSFKTTYNVWFESKKDLESINSVYFHMIYIFPMVMTFGMVSFDMLSFVKAFVIVLVFEPFIFVSSHLFLHMYMLLCYQQGYVGCPWAYFHHYVDSSLYGKLPYGYRNSINQSLLFFSVCSYLWNMPYPLIVNTLVIVTFDVIVHEWYHTPTHFYVSYNPLSTKFVGINAFMSLLQRLKFVDKVRHKQEHHNERASGMDNTTDWVDFGLPVVSWFAEIYGNLTFTLFKYYLKHKTGTSRATHLVHPENVVQPSQPMITNVPEAHVQGWLGFFFFTYVLARCAHAAGVTHSGMVPWYCDVRLVVCFFVILRGFHLPREHDGYVTYISPAPSQT